MPQTQCKQAAAGMPAFKHLQVTHVTLTVPLTGFSSFFHQSMQIN